MTKIKLLILLTLATITNAWAFNNTETYTKNQLYDDMKHVEFLLKKIHPNLHVHRNKKQLKQAFEKIKRWIPARSNRTDALIVIQKMMAAVCDEHTSVDFSEEYTNLFSHGEVFLPTPITSSPEGLHLDMKATHRKPLKVNSINSVNELNLRDLLIETTPLDGCVDNQTIFTRLQPPYLTVFISAETGFKKTYRYKFNSFKKIDPALRFGQLARSPLDSVFEFHTAFKNAGFDFSMSNFYKASQRSGSGIFASLSKDKKIGYIFVSSFRQNKNYAKLLDNELRRLIKANPENIILDLSTNPGGYSLNASRLMSYFLTTSHRIAKYIRQNSHKMYESKDFIWKNPKDRSWYKKSDRKFRRARKIRGQYRLPISKKSFGNRNFKGKLSILVGPKTHSAATLTALILKQRAGAKIIGYQNGGDVNTSCFAPRGTYALPNTGIRIGIPNSCFDRDGKRTKTSRLVPDVLVSPYEFSSDLLHLKTFEAAINNIRNGN